MKQIFLISTILIIIISGCKTPEITTEDKQAMPENKFLYQSIDTKDKSLSKEEIEQITSFANQKAALVCELETVQSESENNPKQQKESVVRIDQQIGALERKITLYLTTDDRVAAFNEAYSYAYENCRVRER